jgi:hypothetical protein
VQVGFIWLRKGRMAGSCEHGNEAVGSLKGKKFLHYLSYYLASKDGLCSKEFIKYLPHRKIFQIETAILNEIYILCLVVISSIFEKTVNR